MFHLNVIETIGVIKYIVQIDQEGKKSIFFSSESA